MPDNSSATLPHKTMLLDARRAVRGGIFGNYVDQIDIFLPVIALAPAATHPFGPENLAGNAGLIFVAAGHAVLGSGTLLAIVALRFVGGIFLGAEYTSAIPLAMERNLSRRLRHSQVVRRVRGPLFAVAG